MPVERIIKQNKRTMQLILNKKVVLLLCFIAHFIDSSIQSSVSTQRESTPEPIVKDAATKSDQDADVVPKTEHAKNVRNVVVGGVQHNYRSSYVGNRLNRRATGATIKQSEAATTEHVPLIKAKRKLTNEFNEEVKYNVGPGVNIGVEKEKELVSVYLDEDCLKDVFTGK